ncbi:UPF0348 protein family [Lentilactobacillus kosonis]|uniref:UPF0348 protein family n=1 Tax=Lentilactobacillus kosonis TaxID=2810561 RepID=A0A401FKW3_9LACO|nr:UPF0348 protein family [Lentilactobacillus kosonis]
MAAGVDLVVELPFFGAVQPSHLFAKNAVRIAQELACESLAFGAEHPDMDYDLLINHQPEHDDSFKQFNQTYASTFQNYLKRQTGITLREPNDILAFGYANANHELGNPLKLVPIQRIEADHNDQQLTTDSWISSASSIRNGIVNYSSEITKFMPYSSFHMVASSFQYSWEQFWPFLRYELIKTPIQELQRIYQMSEGIEHRLKSAAKRSQSFSDFLNSVKTKRYTYTRIQRLCVYVLVHAFSDEMLVDPNYLRPLAFNGQGQRYLNQIKHDTEWPIITKVTDQVVDDWLVLDYQSSMMLELISGENQDVHRYPKIIL